MAEIVQTDSATDNVSEEKATCGGCYFWKEDTDTMSRGICYRYPRTENKDKSEFCGDFKLKPGPKPFDNNASPNTS